MAVSVRIDGDVPVVRVSGEIDVATAPTLNAAMREQIDDGHRVLELDMHRVTFLNSSGLGVLISHPGIRRSTLSCGGATKASGASLILGTGPLRNWNV